jgi:hypothetical protein
VKRTKEDDDAIVASGKYSAGKTHCRSVIVAEGMAPIRPEGRNYFLCDMGVKLPHTEHWNGPDKWWLDGDTGQWMFEGETLKDPYFGGATP